MGECSTGMSGKTGIPQGSSRGLCVSEVSHNAWLGHRHGDTFNDSNGDKGRIRERAMFDLSLIRQRPGYVMPNRLGRQSNQRKLFRKGVLHASRC